MAEACYFVNRSGNQLVTEPLSAVTGFSSIAANLPAMVQNSGIEATLRTINIATREFRWTSSFNLTVPKNKLIAFPSLASSSYQNTYIIGQPISIKRVFKFTGVNDSTGVYQFASSRGGNTFNPAYPADLNATVNLAPKLYGGFQNSFSYKGFELDVLFQFMKQIGPNIFSFLGYPPGFDFNQPVAVLNRWQRTGDSKPYEQFTQSYGSNAGNGFINAYLAGSTAEYTNASFIRLKNLALSYSLPNSWIHRMHIRNCRVYLNGQNLLTITNYLGFDPESQGIVLPPLRVWAAGIQLSL